MRRFQVILLFVAVLLAVGVVFLMTYESVDATHGLPSELLITDGVTPEGVLTTMSLTLDSVPDGLSGFAITVNATDPNVARPVVFDGVDLGLTSLTYKADGGIQFSTVDLFGLVEPGAIDVLLGSVGFVGLAPGTTTVSVILDQVDDDDGLPLDLTVVGGLITVEASRDLDGDGLTEDLNGNGFFDFDDIVELYNLFIEGL